ncbi:MAG: glycosyltransferase [Acidobacteria bacterium]|nr:glycosyltransferase [Acidobacteriota bacterium]
MITALAALAFGVWLYLLLGRGGFWRFQAADRDAAPPAPAGRVAVVIPARNEERSIAESIGSVLRQDYAGACHIILVDDDSDDETAIAALRTADEIGRGSSLTVVRAAPLPSGWTGKLWALSEGVRAAAHLDPEFLLFTDADIVHDTGNLARLMALQRAGNYDLVSFMVRLRTETFAEKALIPAFVFFFLKLYPPAWIRKQGAGTAGAAGGCILMRAEALRRIGGFDAIRAAVIDDCTLARAVKSSGGRIWLGLSSKSRGIHPYGSFAEIGRMISRTAFAQLNQSGILLALTLAGLTITYLLPPMLLLSGSAWAGALGGCAWGLMTIAYAPALRFYGRSVLWAPALPLIAAFYTGATIRSALNYWRGKGGVWKGRVQDRNNRRPEGTSPFRLSGT